jgi:hypothetical protein
MPGTRWSEWKLMMAMTTGNPTNSMSPYDGYGVGATTFRWEHVVAATTGKRCRYSSENDLPWTPWSEIPVPLHGDFGGRGWDTHILEIEHVERVVVAI